MAIYAPDRRVNPTIRRKNTGGRKSVYAGLFLTSMVDMFAILVIFLLQSFDADGELIVLPKGLELPLAVNTGTLQRAPVLSVSREKIEFEGIEIGRTLEISAQTEWPIPKLQEALKAYKAKLELEAQADPLKAGQPIDAKINISADRRLQFQVIKKVIYNASYAGFPDFRFAVFGKSKPAENP